ncbi:MAG: L-serine ammonia-lyase [Alphaproteobacteria bacterium]
MAISVFDLFKIGIGPSSSHTVGPMRAAGLFARRLEEDGHLDRVHAVKVELFGSLGATGVGHGSPKAAMLGLEGEWPESVDTDQVQARIAKIRAERCLQLLGKKPIAFADAEHLVLHRKKSLPGHPNGMRFSAVDQKGEILHRAVYFSIGGGFVVDEEVMGDDRIRDDDTALPFAFTTGEALLRLTAEHGLSISRLMLENEKAWRDEAAIRRQLIAIWQVMQDCVAKGCTQEGILPGGLKIKRRAPLYYRKLKAGKGTGDPFEIMDWVNLYALAVNEENAAGGRVVTAPTNGAAGIIPAVLHYYTRHAGGDEDGVINFLLTAAAIGILCKTNASISGAEVGCQGEVGSACSMAAAGLCEVLGGTPGQVENAAEIAMEHNLGLTCDPVGGLVQVPCIERNAIASVKAINAARMALKGDGSHFVSLDRVIRTMRDTGADMKLKYKETARGGLAVNVVEIPVNVVDC